ncbi:MAG: FAD-dependent oxidoreductase [Saprospiraceae bacterium]|nr:FAD-dependent oxidoreductase [Saprospiraceae bacterium]
MKKILIVGQGIAGTLLAWSLRKRGAEVHIWDGDLAGSSSSVAAGIINPVTGKRFVKSWRFDEFYPIAKGIYQQLEQELGISIWEEHPTLRLLGTPEEANDWAIRCAQPEYADHLGETEHARAWEPFLKPGFRFGVIRKSARVRFPLLLTTFRENAHREGIFFEKSIDYQQVETLLQDYDRIVFCEGWRATTNPFFPESAFRVSKGEALIIRFQGHIDRIPTEMVKKTMLLVPMGDGTFWVGSTYRWHFEDTLPGTDGRDYILGYLHEMFDTPFEIVNHVSGIRPTMIDRRPLIGPSTLNPKIFIFNGLGTKGALLAPFFAEQLAAEICTQKG